MERSYTRGGGGGIAGGNEGGGSGRKKKERRRKGERQKGIDNFAPKKMHTHDARSFTLW